MLRNLKQFNLPEIEEKVLKFWKETDAFKTWEKFEEVFVEELQEINQKVRRLIYFFLTFVVIGTAVVFWLNTSLPLNSSRASLVLWLLFLSIAIPGIRISILVDKRQQLFEDWKSGKISGKLPYR